MPLAWERLHARPSTPVTPISPTLPWWLASWAYGDVGLHIAGAAPSGGWPLAMVQVPCSIALVVVGLCPHPSLPHDWGKGIMVVDLYLFALPPAGGKG